VWADTDKGVLGCVVRVELHFKLHSSHISVYVERLSCTPKSVFDRVDI
jgi:hypothetical protein